MNPKLFQGLEAAINAVEPRVVEGIVSGLGVSFSKALQIKRAYQDYTRESTNRGLGS